MWTISSVSVEALRTVMPRSRTSCGSCGSTVWMRFCTSTWAMSMFVPALNVTVIETRPSPVDDEDMYSMLLDAVDLLLQRRGHAVGDLLGGGARIHRVHR